MNNIFNIRRFSLLAKKDFCENWKKYILQSLVLFSALLIPLLIQSFGVYDGSRDLDAGRYISLNKELLGIGLFVFVVSFPIFLAQMMDIIKNKQGRIHYLTYPASALEKFTTRFLIHTVGYLIVFFIALYFADLIRVMVYSIPTENLEVKHIDLSKLYIKDSWEALLRYQEPTIILSSGYILLLSLYILGSTFWQKKSFVKTTVAIVLTTFVFGVVTYLIATSVFDMTKSIYVPILDSIENIDCIVSGILLTIALFLTTLAFFRFKEAQLIEKW